MILVKISADNERLLKQAKTEAELRGAVDLVLERIEQSYSSKDAKRLAESGPKATNPYNWKTVLGYLRASLGADVVTIPPYPDSSYIGRVNRYCKIYALDKEACDKIVQALADSYLKPPYQFNFIVSNVDRLLGGGYQKGGNMKFSKETSLPRTPRPPSMIEDE